MPFKQDNRYNDFSKDERVSASVKEKTMTTKTTRYWENWSIVILFVTILNQCTQSIAIIIKCHYKALSW